MPRCRTWRTLGATCAAASLTLQACAAPPAYTITAHRPTLTVNTAPALCDPLLRAWEQAFDSDAPLKGSMIDIAAAFPDASVTSNQPGSTRRSVSMPGNMPVDFDDDGDMEALHFENDMLSWRQIGVDIYLFESERVHYELFDTELPRSPLQRRPRGSDRQPRELGYRHLYTLSAEGRGDIDVVHIIEDGGALFVMSTPRRLTETTPVSVDLVHLNAPGQPETVCTVELLPATQTLEEFSTSSAQFAGLRDFYGDSDTCHRGTMGPPPPPEMHLPTMFHRPQAMVWFQDFQMSADLPSAQDAVRELNLMSWALTDPQSWRYYSEFKASRIDFLSEMTAYYRAYFSDTDADATELAENAWRYLLDSTVYGGHSRRASLPGVSLIEPPITFPGVSYFELPITPASSPQEIAAITGEAWLSQVPEVEFHRPARFTSVHSSQIWSETLLASIYTRQPIETIRTHWARREQYHELQLAHFESDYELDQINTLYHTVRISTLLAAVGDDALTELFLELGVDPNAVTNFFGKTPLMYAAQHDQLGSAQRLVAAGAIVTTATRWGAGYGIIAMPRHLANKACGDLDRDARTALMYAAENASPDLIKFLLDAGADPQAVDTQGNPASWYFSRNETDMPLAMREAIEAELSTATQQ